MQEYVAYIMKAGLVLQLPHTTDFEWLLDAVRGRDGEPIPRDKNRQVTAEDRRKMKESGLVMGNPKGHGKPSQDPGEEDLSSATALGSSDFGLLTLGSSATTTHYPQSAALSPRPGVSESFMSSGRGSLGERSSSSRGPNDSEERSPRNKDQEAPRQRRTQKDKEQGAPRQGRTQKE